jgi:hypothetical protein
MKLKSTTILLFLCISNIFGQVYTKNKSKFHFAQGAMGLDFQYVPSSGITHTITNGKTKEYQFGGYVIPRIVIGGLYFYGHADIAFLKINSNLNYEK